MHKGIRKFPVAIWISVIALPAFGQVTSTRTTSYDYQTQDAQGTRISDHARFDTALIACLNTPTCVFVAGGKYRIARAPTPTPPVPVLGSASLSWTAPATFTNGSPITSTPTYTVYHGTTAGGLADKVAVAGLAYVYPNLASGIHYFAVTATVAGGESALSAVVSKLIP